MKNLFPPVYAPPTKKLYNHAISWQISFKFCTCSSFGVMTIWVKFQENWRGCLDHVLRIDTEWPFRDHKSRFIVLLGVSSAIIHEPLKVCRQVKHCKEGFREIFQIGKLCLHLKFLRKSAFLLCFLQFWESSWWFSKKFLATVLAFLQGLYLASSAFKDYTKSLTIVLGLGKNNVPAKKQIGAK